MKKTFLVFTVLIITLTALAQNNTNIINAKLHTCITIKDSQEVSEDIDAHITIDKISKQIRITDNKGTHLLNFELGKPYFNDEYLSRDGSATEKRTGKKMQLVISNGLDDDTIKITFVLDSVETAYIGEKYE